MASRCKVCVREECKSAKMPKDLKFYQYTCIDEAPNGNITKLIGNKAS